MFQAVIQWFLSLNAYCLPHIPRKPSVFTSYLFQLEVKTDNPNCINYTYKQGVGSMAFCVRVCLCVWERDVIERLPVGRWVIGQCYMGSCWFILCVYLSILLSGYSNWVFSGVVKKETTEKFCRQFARQERQGPSSLFNFLFSPVALRIQQSANRRTGILIRAQDIQLHPRKQNNCQSCCYSWDFSSEICVIGKKQDCGHHSFPLQEVSEWHTWWLLSLWDKRTKYSFLDNSLSCPKWQEGTRGI